MRKTGAGWSNFRPAAGGNGNGSGIQASKTPALALVPTNRTNSANSRAQQPQPQGSLLRKSTSIPQVYTTQQQHQQRAYDNQTAETPNSQHATFQQQLGVANGASTPGNYPSYGPPSRSNGSEHNQNGNSTVGQTQASTWSQEESINGNKKPKVLEPQPMDEFDLGGQLKVAMQKIQQLQEENLNLRQEITCNQMEESHKAKTLSRADKIETIFMAKELELKEREDALRQKELEIAVLATEAPAETRSGSRVLWNPILEADSNYETDEALGSFLYETRSEFVVLLRHEATQLNIDGKVDQLSEGDEVKSVLSLAMQSTSSPSAGALATPSSRKLHSAKKAKRIPSPPNTPLSQASLGLPPLSARKLELNSASFFLQNQAFPDKDILEVLKETDPGMITSGSIMFTISNISKWRNPIADLIPPLRALILLKEKTATEVVISVARILYSAAIRFPLFRTSCLNDEVLMETLMDVLLSNAPSAIDVPIFRFLTALADGVLKSQDKASLKPFARVLEDGALLKRITLKDKPVIADCASVLLELLLQKGSDALPVGFPTNPATYALVPSPFGTGGITGVRRCAAVVTHYGNDGIRFLLHHGLLSNLIEVMYSDVDPERECSKESLNLLELVLIFLGSNTDVAAEEHHRLVASLLDLRDLYSRYGEDSQIAKKVEWTLRVLKVT
jgi:hypothetical protein